MLVDLGVSSLQFDSSERGFSFRFDAPHAHGRATSDVETAADLLRRLPEDEIARILFDTAKSGARAAQSGSLKVDAGKPIERTKALADLVQRAVGHKKTETFTRRHERSRRCA